MTVIKHRSGTEAQWASVNPTLAKGEMGFETGTNRFKMGTGATAWLGLPYFINEGQIDTMIHDEIDELIADAVPGTELGYAESVAPFSFTDNATLGTRIPTLTFDIEGKGRPVDIEFYCGEVYHSLADMPVVLFLVVDFAPLSAEGIVTSASSPDPTKGRAIYFKRRLVIPDGVTKNVAVGAFLQNAGTGYVNGNASSAMWLSATSR